MKKERLEIGDSGKGRHNRQSIVDRGQYGVDGDDLGRGEALPPNPGLAGRE
ncbi:MAG: hypothetical protein M1434_02080 [Chloroflexi bacterium]|nr:hypothetical protein [Chloroflexota bacterium]MCL5273517.1 hypothetical protein [Chloroflexota bacterium]